MVSPRPFSRFEWLIAWRYLRARRAEGGVSLLTWISLIGITLAVFALIVVMAVRSGFRNDFVETIVGANAHITIYQTRDEVLNINGFDVPRRITGFTDYEAAAERALTAPGIIRAAPVIQAQILATRQSKNTLVSLYGMSRKNLEEIPGVSASDQSMGSLERFDEGIAIGQGVAERLGVSIGDRVNLLSPQGASTALGRMPRSGSFEVVYIFSAGRYDIDHTRAYMPLAAAQDFFDKTGKVDALELGVMDPELAPELALKAALTVGPDTSYQTWQSFVGPFLRALDVEDNMMFIIMTILVLIASMNIISGLVMLVKNKGRDIGILRTIGLSEGSILRVFFICGAGVGTLGTIFGVTLGCLFAIYIDQIFAFVNWAMGEEVWDPSIRGIYAVPAKLEFWDVISAIFLSLGLSWGVTLFPARRAARMNPVEALRYE